MIEYQIHEGIGHKSPYMEAMRQYFSLYGIVIRYIPKLPEIAPRGDERVIHIHRLGRMYDGGSLETANKFIGKLDYLRSLGWKFVWTIHNIFPLDSNVTGIDHWVVTETGKRMNLIFCHTNIMRANLRKYFGIEAINHSYAADFMLSDISNVLNYQRGTAFTYGFIGNIREYKGIQSLLVNFNRIRVNGYNVNLVIAGNQYKHYFDDRPELQDIMRSAAVTYFDRYVYHDDWSVILDNVDVLVFPYLVDLPIFKFGFYASTIAQAAFMKKLLICPDNENISEILCTSDHEFYYDPLDTSGLYDAMVRAIDIDRGIIRKLELAQFEAVKDKNWKNLTKCIVKCYRAFGVI